MIKLMTKIISTGLIVLGVTACGSSAYDYRKAPLADLITVPIGKTVQAEHAGFSVMFEKVAEDSRCPINARCAWSGVGIVDVIVKKGDQSQKVALSTINYEKFNNTETVFGKDIKLLELQPTKTAGAAKPELSLTTIKLKIN